MAEASEKTALLVIDVINSYDFEDGKQLAGSARDAVPSITKLLGRARDYVNDNYGAWNASANDLIAKVLSGDDDDLLEPLVPAEADAFVVKARHSIFYQTPLDYLLRQEGITRVLLTARSPSPGSY